MATLIFEIGKTIDPNDATATDNNVLPNEDLIYPIANVLALGEIGQLGNVDLTGSPSLANNHFLVYNGTSWVHEQPSDALISLGVTSSAAELNKLDGTTVSASQINYLDIGLLGTSEASRVLTSDVNNSVNLAGDLIVDTSVLKVDTVNNRVGIGTASPAKTFHVVDTTEDVDIARFEGGDGNISINGGAKVAFSRNAINYLTCTDVAGSLRFETGGAGNNRLTIDSSGDSTFTGHVTLDNAKALRLSETDANGSHYIAIKAPDSVSTDTTLTLPDGAGTNGQVLTTSGNSGVLTWSNQSAGVDSASITSQTAKATINNNDLLLIADSEDSNNLKKVTRSSLVDGLTTNNTYSAKTSTFTAALDYHYSINTTGGAVTVNLPAITGDNAGKSLVVKFRSGTNAVTISPNSGDTIEGLNSLSLTDSQAPGQSAILVSDGTSSWEII